MTGPVVIVAPGGAKVAVRVIPPQPIDRDRAFTSYPPARAYAAGLADKLGARIDDLCAQAGGNVRD